jgi:hypothetical protein
VGKSKENPLKGERVYKTCGALANELSALHNFHKIFKAGKNKGQDRSSDVAT